MEFTITQLHTLRTMCVAEQNKPSIPNWAHTYALKEIAPQTKRGLSADFWRKLNNAFSHNNVAVIVIEGKSATVMEVQRNRIFAHHLFAELKSAKQLYWLQANMCSQIGFGEWRWIYKWLIGSDNSQQYDNELSATALNAIAVEKRRDGVFYDMAKRNRYKKIGKRGFNTTFDEVRAMQKMVAYDKWLRELNIETNKILEVL